jgi:hypothetical protein
MYLDSAIRSIDTRLGKGFAREHPELIAAFMQAASTDCAGTILAQQIRAGLENLGDAVDKLSEGRFEPIGATTFSTTFSEMAQVIQNVAGMLDVIGMRMANLKQKYD